MQCLNHVALLEEIRSRERRRNIRKYFMRFMKAFKEVKEKAVSAIDSCGRIATTSSSSRLLLSWSLIATVNVAMFIERLISAGKTSTQP